MLISINDTIIDTKQIHSISPIIKGQISKLPNNKIDYMETHHFEINFFKNIEPKPLYIRSPFIGYYKEPQDSSRIEKEHAQNLIKISGFRDAIIKIWQENQSEIPQFNF